MLLQRLHGYWHRIKGDGKGRLRIANPEPVVGSLSPYEVQLIRGVRKLRPGKRDQFIFVWPDSSGREVYSMVKASPRLVDVVHSWAGKHSWIEPVMEPADRATDEWW